MKSGHRLMAVRTWIKFRLAGPRLVVFHEDGHRLHNLLCMNRVQQFSREFP